MDNEEEKPSLSLNKNMIKKNTTAHNRIILFFHGSVFEQEREMPIQIMLLLVMVTVLNAQTLFQSYIGLSNSSENFQPVNSIELLETRFGASFSNVATVRMSIFIRVKSRLSVIL